MTVSDPDPAPAVREGMTEATVAVSRRRLTLATGVQLGGRIFGAFLGVIVAASLARSLSRPAFGELSLGLTMVSLAGVLTDLGMSEVAVREMARTPSRRPQIAGALAAAQLVIGTTLALAGVAVGFALMGGGQARLMIVFLMAVLPLGAISGLTVAYSARLRAELVIVPTLVQNIVWLAIVLVLGATGGSLALYGVGAFAAAVVQAATTAGLLAGVSRVSFAGVGRAAAELLRYAWPIGLAGVFITAYYRVDGFLLFDDRGPTASAFYSAAYRFIDVLQILPMTLAGVLLPFMARSEPAAGGGSPHRRVFELAVAVLLALVVPVAVFGIILAPGLVDLVYGGAYGHSVALLQILLPAFIPISLAYILTSQLILHNLLRPYVAITFAGAVANIVANVIGIPRLGAPMAAWSTVATEFVVTGGIAVVVQTRLRLRLPAGRILRCLGAAAVSGAVVWFVRAAPVVVGLLVAAVVYPPLLLASRAVRLSEVRALLSRRPAAHA